MRWLKRHFTHNWWLNIDRTMSGSFCTQFAIIIGIVLIVAFVPKACDLNGFDTSNKGNLMNGDLWPLYLFLDGNALGNLVYNKEGHIEKGYLVLATAIYLFGMLVLSGFLISLLTNWYSKRVENYKSGNTTYLWSRHFIILGYDETVPSVIQRIFKEEVRSANWFQRFFLFKKNVTPYILLQSSMSCDMVWEKLQRSAAYHDKNQKNHIILSHGHRISESDLEKLNLPYAKKIYVIGDRCKSTHDSMNIESLNILYKILASYKPVDVRDIVCVVEDDDTYISLQYLDIFSGFKDLNVKLFFYNFYTEWVKTLFYSNTYGEPIKIGSGDEFNRNYPVINQSSIAYDDDKVIHFVIIGLNRFGVSIGIEAAKTIHLPNFVRDSSLKTRITFIDQKADVEMQFFRTRYKDFFDIQSCTYVDSTNETVEEIESNLENKRSTNFLDVSFEFVKGDVFSPQIQNMINNWALDKNPLSLYITFKNQQKGLALALHLPTKVYNNENTNIFVRQTRSDAFVTLHRYAASKAYRNLYPFGMTDIYCDISQHAEIQCITKLLKYFDFDNDAVNDLLTEDFDKSSWDIIMKSADVYSEQLKFMDDADENRYLYKAYSIKWWEYSLMKKDNVDSPAIINDFSDSEIDCYLKTEHNRKNVLLLLIGPRIAPKHQEDFYRSLGKTEIRKSTHTIEPYNKKKVTKEDRNIIRLIPQMIRSSFVSTKSAVLTLRPNSLKNVNGEFKGEWDLEQGNSDFAELTYDSKTGEFDTNKKKKHLKIAITPQYDYLYDPESGILKKTPLNCIAKVIDWLNPQKTLIFDDKSGDFIEVPSNLFYRLIYKVYNKLS